MLGVTMKAVVSASILQFKNEDGDLHRTYAIHLFF